MKALVRNNHHIELKERKMPKIIHSRDAIVKVKMSSICTSDLHIIHGFVPKAKNDIVLGHEFVGEIVELGSDIKNLSVGDRVSANVETFCGECFFCKRGFINNCEQGGWELGCEIDGCQAEYVRVPFADMGLNKLPENVSYKNALLVGDVLASGYFGAELCEIKSEDVVAIIGVGPVGLCTMASVKTFEHKSIVAIDIDDNRLEIVKKEKLADYFLNPNKCDIEKEIKKITQNRGADCVIEVAGGKDTFEMAWKIARPNAIVALVAMYEEAQKLPLPDMYGKNLIFKTGGVDANHSELLLKYISEGKINTDFIFTHEFNFDEIQKAYEFFENKKENCMKVIIKY
ncbi:alcohol dehydrogenase catalytic domain-containing protein [bacterium]|nr:alcohol dehydrogenase catalytic domain-containing protein [bacterium]